MLGVSAWDSAGTRTIRWINGMRYRERPALHHSDLRWYRDETTTYRLTARCILPTGLGPLARVSITGLDNIRPRRSSWPRITRIISTLTSCCISCHVTCTSRRDRMVSAQVSCAQSWRRLGAFPADAWGIRYGLKLLAEDSVVGVSPQGHDLRGSRDAVRRYGSARACTPAHRLCPSRFEERRTSTSARCLQAE